MANPIITSEPNKVINSFDSPWNASALPIQYTVSNDKYPVGAVVSNYYTEIVISVNAVVIATIQQLPDSNNETKIDVRKYVQSALSFIPSTLFGTGIDTNASCFFSISGEEKYIDSGGSPQSNPIDNGGNAFYASNSALQFGEPNGGNMYDYVLDSSKLDLAKWMTGFVRGSIIDINNFTFSIIVNDPDFDLSVDQFDKNGGLLVNEIVNIPDTGVGVYRLSSSLFDINNDADYITVLATKGGIALTELLPIDVDLSCFIPFESPSNLIVSNPLTNEGVERVDALELDWSSNSNLQETGFGIERSVDGITFVEIDTVGTGVLTYTNDSLTYNDTWFYRVRALGINPSGYSNIDSGTVSTNFLIHPNIKRWYRSDRVIFNGNAVSEEIELTGSGVNPVQTNSSDQPFHNSKTSTSNGLLDGHDGIYYSRGINDRFIDVGSSFGTGIGSNDYFIVFVEYGNPTGNTNPVQYARNDAGDTSTSFSMFSTDGAALDGRQLFTRGESGARYTAEINPSSSGFKSWMTALNSGSMSVWKNGVLQSSINYDFYVSAAFNTIRFGNNSTLGESGSGIVKFEFGLFTGRPEDYPSLVNDIFTSYLNPRYVSLGIVSPNII